MSDFLGLVLFRHGFGLLLLYTYIGQTQAVFSTVLNYHETM